VAYPNLVDDLTATLEVILGPEVYTPVVADTYCSKLRSHTQAQQQSAPHLMRQTPRFLRIIAAPDDEQRKRLEGEGKGDLAVLRWDVVENYIGSTANLLKTPVRDVR
jgi:inhibitor of KinA sporulation pathway (predicted exonuclease)